MSSMFAISVKQKKMSIFDTLEDTDTNWEKQFIFNITS